MHKMIRNIFAAIAIDLYSSRKDKKINKINQGNFETLNTLGGFSKNSL